MSQSQKPGTILTEIGYIKANTEGIKTEQKEQRRTNVELVSRMSLIHIWRIHTRPLLLAPA